MKKKFLATLILASMFFQVPLQSVFAEEIELKSEITTDGQKSTEYEFYETPQEIIDEMKSNMESYSTDTPEPIIMENKALSSLMATAFDVAGFNNVASFLNYSMLSMREDPRIETSGSGISTDMWNYSPDFEKVITDFLWKARANGGNNYFATTNMNFTMPNASKPSILLNTQLRKQTDLFGTLHGVTINLGISKVPKLGGDIWHMEVIVRDRFDFKKEDYNGLVDLVNNIANHEQELGLVKPYDLIIYASRPNLPRPPFGVTPW